MATDRKELEELELLLEEQENRKKYRRIDYMFPEEGPFARRHYAKHLKFMKAGASYPQRAIVGANRVGKSETCHYEVACHATGIYPEWWEGRRFKKPVNILCLGVTHESTRDVCQLKLIGGRHDEGSGLIPKDLIDFGKITTKPGTPNARGDAYVTHLDAEGKPDGLSRLQFKSYVSGYEVFMGTEYDVIMMDEEPPEDIYSEALMRTATTKGIIICCFTPLKSISDVFLSFIPDMEQPPEGKVNEHRFTQVIGWDDMPPHLGESEKANIKSGIMPHQLAARTTGIPSIGEMEVYPVAEADITVEPFSIPDDWDRAYGLDVGWNMTAGVWGARDPNTDVWYLYREYHMGQVNTLTHAAGIKGIEPWCVGSVDPAANGRGQHDGKRLLEEYHRLGLNLVVADNAVETGISRCFQLLSTGRVKIFNTLTWFLKEKRTYRRNELGHIVKKNDHLMDAFRYLFATGIYYAQSSPKYENDAYDDYRYSFEVNTTRDSHTGY